MEKPVEATIETQEANSESDSEEAPEKIVEIKEEETVEEAPEEEIPEENPENTSEEVPAETEQESIPTEESLNLEKSVTALAANYALTTLKSPGIAVQAGTSITYYDENGKEQTADCNDIITQENIQSYGTLTTGWYAVEGTVTGDNRIEVQGTVNLILEDGCSFTVNGGIEVNEGNALTIWGQQKGNGELKAQNVAYYCAGIGGGDGKSGGNITVAGGNIIAMAYSAGAGIGGGAYGNGGTITITGGKIKANGIDGGAGIGGGRQSAGGTIKIQGGNIYASIRDGFVANGDFAIGAGMNGSGGSLSIKESVVITRGKINEYNKDTWSGMIFENTETDGIVYGTPTLSQEFILESTRNLLIPENTSLQGTAKLINEGHIYVQGTLTEPVSGNVYYPLTIVDGTAEGSDVSTYKNQLYGRADGTITLKGTNVSAGQAAVWTCSDDTVTVTNNTFTMPTKALTFTPKYVTPVTYWNPVNQKNETAGCDVVLTKNNSAKYKTLKDGWYAIEGNIAARKIWRITIMGDVNLILKDDCTFSVVKGISVNQGNTLTIWGQQEGNGALTVSSPAGLNAGIGGDNGETAGKIKINGGNISVKGGANAAGIGGGNGGGGGTIIIAGGKVNAEGGINATGIGGGNGKGRANIRIRGGIVYASVKANQEQQVAIGGGLQSELGITRITNSIVITSGKINESDKDTWSGMIFEDSETDGIVYGDPTLSQKFTLEDTQNLLIQKIHHCKAQPISKTTATFMSAVPLRNL